MLDSRSRAPRPLVVLVVVSRTLDGGAGSELCLRSFWMLALLGRLLFPEVLVSL